MAFDFGLRLFQAAGEPRKFVEIAGSHNDGFLFSADRYERAWAQWLDLLANREPENDLCETPQPLRVVSDPL